MVARRLIEKARDALLAVQEWARNLTPADGVVYGSYWPEFAVREALALLPLGAHEAGQRGDG